MKRLLLTLALVSVVAVPARAQQLTLQIQDGRVTLDATNVPARQILAEWAKVGGTKVVGAEKMTGAPLTLKLVAMPEQQALDIILRNAAGFIAAQRQTAAAGGASVYDRILILATSSAPAPPTASANRPNAASGAPGMSGVNNGAGTQRRIPPRPANLPPSSAENETEAEDEREEPEQNAGNPVFTFPSPPGAGQGNQVFVPMNPNNAGVFGAATPGAASAPVITLQPNAQGQPTIYNFVPNMGNTATPTPPPGFTVIGAPQPGMIQQPVPAPGQPVPGQPAPKPPPPPQ